LARLYQSLRPQEGSKLAQLQSLSLDEMKIKSRSRLEEICQEQDFAATFVELEELSKTGLNMCLVQLSTVPVAVCHGMGKGEDAAAEAAAFGALEFLAVMTK